MAAEKIKGLWRPESGRGEEHEALAGSFQKR